MHGSNKIGSGSMFSIPSLDRRKSMTSNKSMKLVEMIKDKSIDDLMEMSFDVLAQK